MFASSRGQVLARTAAKTTTATSTLAAPSPLQHALKQQCARAFSASAVHNSKLGRTPLTIPPGVELTIGEPIVKKDPTTYLKIPRRKVTVAGPLGELSMEVPPFLHINHDTATRRITLAVEDREVRHQRAMWGTTWAHLNQYILGVSEGNTAVLRLVGIGYRATVEARPEKEEFEGQQFVILKLGFNHPVEVAVPKGIKASSPQPTRILLEGVDRQQLMLFAGTIRRWRKPEPYKGKGIFINDETIKLKAKKVK